MLRVLRFLTGIGLALMLGSLLGVTTWPGPPWPGLPWPGYIWPGAASGEITLGSGDLTVADWPDRDPEVTDDVITIKFYGDPSFDRISIDGTTAYVPRRDTVIYESEGGSIAALVNTGAEACLNWNATASLVCKDVMIGTGTFRGDHVSCAAAVPSGETFTTKCEWPAP